MKKKKEYYIREKVVYEDDKQKITLRVNREWLKGMVARYIINRKGESKK
jgi:hypothetical protein